MTTLTTIENDVMAIIAEEADYDVTLIQLNSVLTTDIPMDSLAMVELVMRLEEEFDVEIADDNMPTKISVGDVVDLVTKQITKS